MMIVRAFAETSSERQVGFALGPIPRSAMKAWCKEQRMYPHIADYVIRILRRVDGVMMRRARAAAKATTPPSKR
jgi:hypothetical protein